MQSFLKFKRGFWQEEDFVQIFGQILGIKSAESHQQFGHENTNFDIFGNPAMGCSSHELLKKYYW